MLSTRDSFLDDNTLKILLCLSLVFKDEDGFWNAARQLRDTSELFRNFLQIGETYFKKTGGPYSGEVRQLLELALQASIISNEVDCAREILKVAFANTYLLSVDEQTVWFAVQQTQTSMGKENNFSMLRLLLSYEVRYNIRITDKNKKQVEAIHSFRNLNLNKNLGSSNEKSKQNVE